MNGKTRPGPGGTPIIYTEVAALGDEIFILSSLRIYGANFVLVT